MTNCTGRFHRDASNRLAYEIFDLNSDAYAKVCNDIVRQFDLSPASELVTGLDEISRDYSDGRGVVGLEWDNWSGFIVVAKNFEAEALVRSIAQFLGSGR